MGSLLFTELWMLALHVCTCSSSAPKSKYSPKQSRCKGVQFVHVMGIKVNFPRLVHCSDTACSLVLYTHICGRHGYLVLTSCVVTWYMHLKLIVLVCTKQLNIPTPNSRISREFCTVTDFLNLLLLLACIVVLLTNACMQSTNSTKTK